MSTATIFTYTGHESFACRSYWLKKGFDFIEKGEYFSNPDATSKLGVGKNMVRSIKYWLKAFSLLEENSTDVIAKRIFSDDNGWDPFLEDINTIWLLHYLLVKGGYAKIYSDLFNDFRKRQFEFTFENFERFLSIKVQNVAEKSLKTDINVLKNSYTRPNRKQVNIEDSFSVFLQELNLIESISSGIYHFNTRPKDTLNNKVFFFAILDNFHNQASISFNGLATDKNSPGNVFCLTQGEIYNRIKQLTKDYDGVVFTDDAGIRELQIDKKYFNEYISVLDAYYHE
jgi:hypothetical protein